MATIKKFKIYIILFILGFLFVEIFTNILMKERFKDITNHDITIVSPRITITESKATNVRGYINGNILNDTGEHIRDKYLQFDFYDKDGVYIGTESKEIKYFNVKEKINFEIQYEYSNVDKIKISFVNEVIKPKNSMFNFMIKDETVRIAVPISLVLLLTVVIP